MVIKKGCNKKISKNHKNKTNKKNPSERDGFKKTNKICSRKEFKHLF